MCSHAHASCHLQTVDGESVTAAGLDRDNSSALVPKSPPEVTGCGLALARLPQLPFIEPPLDFLPLVDFAFALAPLVDAGTENSLEPPA